MSLEVRKCVMCITSKVTIGLYQRKMTRETTLAKHLKRFFFNLGLKLVRGSQPSPHLPTVEFRVWQMWRWLTLKNAFDGLALKSNIQSLEEGERRLILWCQIPETAELIQDEQFRFEFQNFPGVASYRSRYLATRRWCCFFQNSSFMQHKWE